MWPPSCSISRSVAAIVPPVASRSSTASTRCPGLTASSWMASASRPYSSSYSTSMVLPGSLPSFRTGTKPALSSWASASPKMNPRDSTATTRSESRGHRAARGEQVAVGEPVLARLDRVVLDGERAAPALELVLDLDGLARQPAELPHGDRTRAQDVCERPAEDEPTRLDGDH